MSRRMHRTRTRACTLAGLAAPERLLLGRRRGRLQGHIQRRRRHLRRTTSTSSTSKKAKSGVRRLVAERRQGRGRRTPMTWAGSTSSPAKRSPAKRGEANSEGDYAVGGRAQPLPGRGRATSFVGALPDGDLGIAETGDSPTGAYRPRLQVSLRTRHPRHPRRRLIAFQSRAPLTGSTTPTPRAASPKSRSSSTARAAQPQLRLLQPQRRRARAGAFPELRLPYNTPAGPPKTSRLLRGRLDPDLEHPLHASNVLSADGKRLFFNSNDALLPRDTNGAQDVYEWEAPGSGRCGEPETPPTSPKTAAAST